MMAKIVKGSSFGGCVRYVTDKKDAKLLAAEGVLLENKQSVIDSFETQSLLNPRLGRKVGHISLNFSAQDSGRIDDAFMLKIAGEYMQKMGVTDTQFIIVRHNDREHPHCHIVFNRVDNDGQTISDKNDRLRSVKACRTLTEKYGLYIANGKENVNRQRLRDPDSVKYAIYDAVKAALPQCKNWGDLEKRLAQEGIAVTFKYSGGTDIRQGVIFGKDGLSFNGSKIDRAFSFSKLDAALNANTQRREVRNVSPPTFTPLPQPDRGHRSEPSHSHSFSSGNIFSGLNFDQGAGDAPDSTPPKRKKKKRQYKPSW
ncbi:MAG: relaxase/mobilization nuclease domain-containing protein [Alistipes sp.]|jgi:hypothetical protein|nr:relaxase/mobilization nuclease domain-containing protein [Alistipes sp.]